MSVSALSTVERTRLVDLLFDASLTTSQTSKTFRELFQTTRYTAVCHELKVIVSELTLVSDGAAMLAVLVVLDVMRRASCDAAKVAFYDILVYLERVMRHELYLVEQFKYATKESKEAKKCAELGRLDVYRTHCILKAFAFQLLAGSVEGEDKLATIATWKQETVDAVLEGWEKTGLTIKETLADIAHCWQMAHEKERCDVVHETATKLNALSEGPQPGLALRLPRIAPPCLPVMPGELHYLLPGNASPMLLHTVMIPPTDSWKATQAWLLAACRAPLSKADQQSLLTAVDDVIIKQMGISREMMCALATFNADACAALLMRMPNVVANEYIRSMLKGGVGNESVETVLLHAAHILEQDTVKLFISTVLSRLRQQQAMSANITELLRSFALVLHQLVTKASRENKEIYIPEGLKAELADIFLTSGAPEIASRWEDMKAV